MTRLGCTCLASVMSWRKCSRTHTLVLLSFAGVLLFSAVFSHRLPPTSSSPQLATAWQLHHGRSSLRASCNHSLITANDHDDYFDARLSYCLQTLSCAPMDRELSSSWALQIALSPFLNMVSASAAVPKCRTQSVGVLSGNPLVIS